MSDIKTEVSHGKANANPIRTSFSLDRTDRILIKSTSERYGVPQSEIVNRSADLFEWVAHSSLKKREKICGSLDQLADQASCTLVAMEKMAPHLSTPISALRNILWELLEAEKEAIQNRRIHGVDVERNSALSGIWDGECSYEDDPLDSYLKSEGCISAYLEAHGTDLDFVSGG